MVVFVLDNNEELMRGELTKWMLEVRPNIFVGNISKTIRDLLWSKINETTIKGGLMIYDYKCEQGYKIEMFGSPDRYVVEMNGVQLIARKINKE